jgi:hypothetical protein
VPIWNRLSDAYKGTAYSTQTASVKAEVQDYSMASGVDNELLQRIANDPDAGIYNPNKPVGEYVYAPTTSQLNQAFSKIASQVLRLSK